MFASPRIYPPDLSRASEWLFPNRCRHCGETFRLGLSNILCAECIDSAPSYSGARCFHCGLSLPEGALGGGSEPRCRDCGGEEYHLDRCAAYGPYQGALRLAHHAFKFEGMEHLATALGARLSQALEVLPPAEVLVPVPVRPERRRERGYAPTERLAGELGRLRGLPVEGYLAKTRPTPHQVDLDEEERLGNLRGAFEWRGGFSPPERAVLVDDVYTTGGTLEECAKVLKAAGVAWVGAVVLGRTPRRKG